MSRKTPIWDELIGDDKLPPIDSIPYIELFIFIVGLFAALGVILYG